MRFPLGLRFCTGFIWLLLSLTASAKEVPVLPNPPQLVNDYAVILNQEERPALEKN